MIHSTPRAVSRSFDPEAIKDLDYQCCHIKRVLPHHIQQRINAEACARLSSISPASDDWLIRVSGDPKSLHPTAAFLKVRNAIATDSRLTIAERQRFSLYKDVSRLDSWIDHERCDDVVLLRSALHDLISSTDDREWLEPLVIIRSEYGKEFVIERTTSSFMKSCVNEASSGRAVQLLGQAINADRYRLLTMSTSKSRTVHTAVGLLVVLQAQYHVFQKASSASGFKPVLDRIKSLKKWPASLRKLLLSPVKAADNHSGGDGGDDPPSSDDGGDDPPSSDDGGGDDPSSSSSSSSSDDDRHNRRKWKVPVPADVVTKLALDKLSDQAIQRGQTGHRQLAPYYHNSCYRDSFSAQILQFQFFPELEKMRDL
jgi:hypothetical protein